MPSYKETDTFFEIRKQEKKDPKKPDQWYWRLWSNHNVICHSEGYRDKRDCERGIEIAKATTEKTPVKYPA